MENNYLCPFCRGQLKVGERIVFTAECCDGKGGLLFLSPKLGDYHLEHHPDFPLKAGEHLTMKCPICHANLSAIGVNRNLAEVIMVDPQNEESDIYFSEIVGEKCTYKVHAHEVESYGENSSTYMNYFGV